MYQNKTNFNGKHTPPIIPKYFHGYSWRDALPSCNSSSVSHLWYSLFAVANL